MDLKKLRFVFPIILWSTIAILLLYRLEQVPKLWWDEGWTLSVARNWVENNHFGHYLENEPIPPRSPVRFVVVWPIVLSFKSLGVGVFQGRLPGVIFTFLTFIVLFYLTSRIYHKKVAYVTIIILVFLSGENFNPIMIGRQVLAEMPMLFYLLSGYLFFWFALRISVYWVVPTSLFWGVALLSKLQVPPFFVASVALMILMLIMLKRRRKLRILAFALIGTLCVVSILITFQNKFVPSLVAEKPLLDLLINSVILVLSWSVRQSALAIVLIYGIPLIMGFLFFFSQLVNFLKDPSSLDYSPLIRKIEFSDLAHFKVLDEKYDQEVIKIGIWGLGASWFIWYLLFGMYWYRYLFPAYFIGSVFISAFLYEATNQFNLPVTVLNASLLILRRQLNLANLLSLFGVLIIGIGIGHGAKQLFGALSNQPILTEPIVSYIENYIPAEAVIETFESELFFLAPRNYHFPSDMVSMQLVRRLTIDPYMVIDYDPLEYDPDYLISGYSGELWKLYGQVVESEAFELVDELPGYDIFRRVK